MAPASAASRTPAGAGGRQRPELVAHATATGRGRARRDERLASTHRAADRLGRGSGLGGADRCRRRRGARSPRRGRRAPRTARVAGGLQAGDPAGDVPASDQSITRSRMAGVAAWAARPATGRSLERARRDHRGVRHEVQRGGERIVVGGERDVAAGLADDQLARRGVHRAAALQRRPSRRSGRPRPGRSPSAIVPMARRRWAALGQRVGGRGRPSADRRIPPRGPRAGRRHGAALASEASSGHAVELRAAGRVRRPTPRRARSPVPTEHDVGHGRRPRRRRWTARSAGIRAWR